VFRFATAVGRQDVAVDLGTANTVLYARSLGSLLSEPSVVAVDCHTGKLQGVGREAAKILDRGEIRAIRPLRDGVIADLTATEQMLRCLIDRVYPRRWPRPRVLASVPTGVSEVEQCAVAEACLSAGARKAYLIEKPVAAALGAGLPVGQPTGSMVLELGAGSSEVALISMGSVVMSRSLRVGATSSIWRSPGTSSATTGCTSAPARLSGSSSRSARHPRTEAETRLPVSGHEITTELLKTVPLTGEEIRCVVDKPLSRIITAVIETLDRTPPALGADVIEHGITLTGGGSLLRGLAHRLRSETGMTARVAPSPQTCIVLGSAKVLASLEDVPRSRSSARHELALATPVAFS